MQHDGTFQVVKVTLDSGESLEATAGHPFYIQGKGWNVAANRKVGDALQLHNGITLVIKTVETSTRFAKVYNFSVAQNANHFVWKDGVLVHNGNICGTDKVKDILKNRRGSVKDAPLPEGSPSWNEVLDKMWDEIVKAAEARKPGYKTIKKLLTDGRFKK